MPNQKTKIITFWNFRVASKTCLKQADDELRQQLLERLVDTHLMSPFLQLSFNHDPQRLPLRELSHGSWSELFLVYKSYCRVKNEAPACRSTFFQAAVEWKVCLRFQKKTKHAQCATCAQPFNMHMNLDRVWLYIFILYMKNHTAPGITPVLSPTCLGPTCLCPGLQPGGQDFGSTAGPLHSDLEGPAGLLHGAWACQSAAWYHDDHSGLEWPLQNEFAKIPHVPNAKAYSFRSYTTQSDWISELTVVELEDSPNLLQ